MNEYWWEMRVLRNAAMHSEGLSREQLRRNTNLGSNPDTDPKGELFSMAMRYLLPIEDIWNGLLEPRTGADGPVYTITKRGRGKLAEYRGEHRPSSMNEYWWEMRVLRNLAMHPEGLPQSQIIRNTGVEHDLVGSSLGYLAPNNFIDSELLFDGEVFNSDKDMPGLVSDALDRLTAPADRAEKRTHSIIPVYRINERGLGKLAEYRRAYDSLNRI